MQLLSMISLMAAVMAVQAALIYQVQNTTSIAHAAGIGAAANLFACASEVHQSPLPQTGSLTMCDSRIHSCPKFP
jgi:hypothetical protein